MLISGWATWPGCQAEPVRGRGARVRPVSAWQLRQIRVLLIEQTPTFEVAIRSPYRVTDAAGRELASVPRPLPRSQARVSRTVPPGLVLGGRLYKAMQIDVIPEDDGALELVVNIGGRKKQARRYRGRLRCSLTASGRIDVVNALDIEAYLMGVLRGELPPSFHKETFRAQAVAARTYALYEKFTAPADARWDVRATQSSQVYIGMEGETQMARNAVQSTHGRVCTWLSPAGRKIFCTYYSSTCGGVTQDAANVRSFDGFPRPTPLAGGVRCGYCTGATFFHWPAVRVSKAEIGHRLVAKYPRLRSLGPVDHIDVIDRTPDGRPKRVRVVGRDGNTTLRSEDLRLCLGPAQVKSTRCTITNYADSVEFSRGRGFGHGMGMCQWGAQGLALAGRNASQILQFYYRGCGFEKAYD